jgi:NAD(P)-dependent dehydrogenase (short-subunit alcohol dehydrogenase family)
MVKDAFPNAETMNIAIQAQPLKRMGTPEDIAYTVVYLASDESNFTNGTSILVDGGFNVQASGSTTRVE